MQKNLCEITTLSSIVFLTCTLTSSTSVFAEVINGDELPECTEVTDQLVSSHHIRFSSGSGHVSFATDGGRLGIYGTDPYDGYSGCAYIYFHASWSLKFTDPNDDTKPGVVNGTIEVTWGDGGGDTDYLTMKVYDIVGNLIDEIDDSGTHWQTIIYEATNAHKLVFEPSAGAPGSSDTFVDQLIYPTPGPAFNLTVSGPCPGLMDACVSGATPFARIGFAYGFSAGSTSVPPCPGLSVDINNAKLAGLANADSNGDACINGNVPAGACGKAIVQAVDLTACITSNIAGT